MRLFKVIVAGSRNITSKDMIIHKLDILLSQKIKEGEKIQIISGAARGVDRIGEEYAAARGFLCKRFSADWDTHGKRAGYLRNCQMADNADALVAFWDGESPGTRHMIQTAKNSGLVVRVIHVKKQSDCCRPPKKG